METEVPVLYYCDVALHYGTFDLPKICTSRFNYKRGGMMSEFSSGNGSFNMSNDSFAGDTEVAFDNLYPAVIECFIIIISGYFAGKFSIIKDAEANGINAFVGYFALPALIFKSMAQLDFSAVDWYFLLALTLAKGLIFFAVVVVTGLVAKTQNIGKAGLFGIFCTQSNDFALGYPIVVALYKNHHPELPAYLYLLAPISLVLLNPIGFLLMEFQKKRDEKENAKDGILFRKIFAGVALNPVVIMTVLGIVANVIFDKVLPPVLEGILTVLGSSYSATALFALGLRLVGKVHNLRGPSLVVPGILITVKSLGLPLITRELVSALAGSNTNETSVLSNFGFLYGTIPTAPTVFVFAAQYNLEVDLIAAAMVIGTFLSAPLMFISAKMVTLNSILPSSYISELSSFLLHIGVIGLVSGVWVFVLFLMARRWTKAPQFATMGLLLSQMLSCIGVVLWVLVDTRTCNIQLRYTQFFILAVGVFSSRFWTAALAVTLLILARRGHAYALQWRWKMTGICFGIPSILVLVLVVIFNNTSTDQNHQDINFQYGTVQAVVAIFVLVSCTGVTVVSLILQQRSSRQYSRYSILGPCGTVVPFRLAEEDSISSDGSLIEEIASSSPRTISRCDTSVTILPSDEDQFVYPPCSRNLSEKNLFPAPPAPTTCLFINSAGCEEGSVTSRLRTVGVTPAVPLDDALTLDGDTDTPLFSPSSNLGPGRSLSEEDAEHPLALEPQEREILRDRDDEYQILRHIVLLLFLCLSMIVGFALSLWSAVLEKTSGIYLELVFLDVALNYGQGFFAFLIFGLDTRQFVAPFFKCARKVLFGEPQVQIPWKISEETRQVVDQFLAYHMDKCVKDIVRDRKFRQRRYSCVFSGTELVDWLLLVGAAKSRAEGVRYGRHLLKGRVLEHVDQMHHFHDLTYFYRFVSQDGCGCR